MSAPDNLAGNDAAPNPSYDKELAEIQRDLTAPWEPLYEQADVAASPSTWLNAPMKMDDLGIEPLTPEQRESICRRVQAALESPDTTVARVQTPNTDGSHLRRCCADLCDPAKVADLADRTVRQESNPAPDPEKVYEEACFPKSRGNAKTNLTFDEFMEKIRPALAPDTDGPQAPKISNSSLTYEEVLGLAHEVWALIEDGGANNEMAVSALMFRVLANEGVTVR